MKELRAYFKFFSLEIFNFTQYRFEFWVYFFGTGLIKFLLSYLLWQLIYGNSPEGFQSSYTFEELITYFLLINSIDRGIRGKDIGLFASEIYEGTLTKYLLYPSSFMISKYATQFAHLLIYSIQIPLYIGIASYFFNHPPPPHFLTSCLPQGLVFLFLSSLLYFFMLASFEYVAFWAEKVWSLLVMFRFCIVFFGGAMIPLEFFPKSTQAVMYWTPFPYLLSVPVKILSGKTNLSLLANEFFIIIFWILFFYTLSQYLWMRGRKKYTGVGI